MIVRGMFGTGPVGTGSYMIGYRRLRPGFQDVEVWLSLMFVPLIPLSRWRVSVAAEGDGERQTLDLTVHSRSRVALGASIRRIAKGLAIAGLAVVPMAFAVWTIGVPWATELLSGVLGDVRAMLSGLGTLGGKLGRIVETGIPLALELGVVLAGAAIPVFILMYLDERTARVPLLDALGVRRDRAAEPKGIYPEPRASEEGAPVAEDR